MWRCNQRKVNWRSHPHPLQSGIAQLLPFCSLSPASLSVLRYDEGPLEWLPLGNATRVRLCRGCKAVPIDSFNGNKNTTNLRRRATYTLLVAGGERGRGLEREREKGRGRRVEGNEGREEAAWRHEQKAFRLKSARWLSRFVLPLITRRGPRLPPTRPVSRNCTAAQQLAMRDATS